MTAILLALWLGITLGTAAVQRVHAKWGVVAHYSRWEWLIVPLYLGKQVIGTLLHARPRP